MHAVHGFERVSGTKFYILTMPLDGTSTAAVIIGESGVGTAAVGAAGYGMSLI